MATPSAKNPPRYVDDYDAVYYDMSYKPAAKGHFSKWLIVRYEDNTIIDIHLDWLTSQCMTEAAAEQERREAAPGAGDRLFPREMNLTTTPRLWAAKFEVLKVMEDHTAVQILEIFPTLFLLLIAGTSGTAGGGISVTRRPLKQGSVSRLVTSRIHRPITEQAGRSKPSPDESWEAWDAWNKAHSDYGKWGTDVTGGVKLPDPPAPLPVYHHVLNKGGLHDIMTHQRLISTTARGIAGGSDGMRAVSGTVPRPYPNSGTYIEFVTGVPGNPTRFMGGRPGTQWYLPEGEYLQIQVIRVIENGQVTFENPGLFFHYLKGG